MAIGISPVQDPDGYLLHLRKIRKDRPVIFMVRYRAARTTARLRVLSVDEAAEGRQPDTSFYDKRKREHCGSVRQFNSTFISNFKNKPGATLSRRLKIDTMATILPRELVSGHSGYLIVPYVL